MNPDFRPAIRRALTAPCAPSFLVREINRRVRRKEVVETPRVNCCYLHVRFGTPRRCRMPARADGYCWRHNPEKLRATAARTIARAEKTLAGLNFQPKETSK